jgi:predicted alpha-1,2-mannosidase
MLQAQTKAAPAGDLVQYVDPTIGGIGRMLNSTPALIQLPHGMARVIPATSPGMMDWYLSDSSYGVSVGQITVMPVSEHTWRGPMGPVASRDHDREVVRPFYYSLISDAEQTRIEAAPAAKSIAIRFGLPMEEARRISFGLRAGWTLSVTGASTLAATGKIGEGDQKPIDGFATFHFTQPVDAASLTCSNTSVGPQARTRSGAGQQTCEVTFTGDSRGPLEMRMGLSYISAEQADANLRRDIGDKTFEQVRAAARAAWNEALHKIVVDGGTEKQRRIFYTSLYRSLLRMTDITEDGRYFSGYDQKVHDADGHDFYVDDGMWDTYRSLHPLQLLIEPKAEQDAIRSYIRMYEQGGWLPLFPSVSGERQVMLGNHTASMIADAYTKGYRDFDAETALQGMKKNALEGTHLPWRRGPATDLDRFYQQSGYFPALAKGEEETEPRVHPFERRQASSVTLENAYDDWCIAQLARALGHDDDAKTFTKRAGNYALLFNPATHFIEAKSQDDNWVEDFDPKLGGGQGGRAYFAEVDSWVDTFHVQHDPAGLIKLMGGRDAFIARLDALFQEPYGTNRFTFLGQFPDMTGLIGLYPQGNEPAFHIPYLYVAAGQPWKTQRRVRQIMDVQYGDGPQGISGDEDGGAMSSWYVFSALGFYPMCPGSPVYVMGSPLFSRSVVALGNGKQLTVVAHGNSAVNKYIRSATLNGKPLLRAWFRHEDIVNGGMLVLEMSATPNLVWGNRPEDAPPSMSSER